MEKARQNNYDLGIEDPDAYISPENAIGCKYN